MSIAISEFGFTEDQKIMRSSVLDLLEKVFTPEMIKQHDEDRAFPFDAYAALAHNGWLGLPHDAEFGGMDGSFKDLVIIIEAIAQHNAQLASAYLTTVIYGGMQVKHGASPALKSEIMPGVIDGDIRLAICISEPETGSDVASIRTRATQDGDDYIINGQKIYITCAHVAHHVVVATKTDPDARHKGISLFLVDVRTPGVTIRPLKGLGRRMIHTNEVFFDNVRVPATRMLGKKNDGWKGLMRGLNMERLLLSAAACGNMAKIIDYARDFALNRKQFGEKITHYQAIAHKFADMQIMLESSRAMVYRTAEMLDAGETPNMETAATKVLATENNSRCADMGIQIMGGAGYMMDYEMQMYFRDARVGAIGGGTSEIMRTVIAKNMSL